MQTLENSEDKIAAICKQLKEETLEPAKQEAQKVISDAQAEAERIISEAKGDAEELLQQARAAIAKERNVFESSLAQSGKQSVEALRQDIEKRLFNQELASMVEGSTADTALVSKIIDALIEAVRKDGVQADLSAVVPRAVPAKDVAATLGEAVVDSLKGGALQVGSFKGGAQLKWHDRKLTLDITDEALKELLSQYVRKDFRKLLFGE